MELSVVAALSFIGIAADRSAFVHLTIVDLVAIEDENPLRLLAGRM